MPFLFQVVSMRLTRILRDRMTDSRGIASETVPVSEVSHEDLVFWIV